MKKKLLYILIVTCSFANAQWSQIGSDIDGLVANEQSGTSSKINADGTVLVIGATRAFDNEVMSGKVRVFDWNGSEWIQRGADILGSNQGDVFGESVSISADGNTIAVGAPSYLNPEYLSDNGPEGYTRIFEWNGSEWNQKGADIIGELPNDTAGGSVSLNAAGNVIAIGATSNSSDSGSMAGHCRIYEWNGDSWIQRGADIDGEAANDFSGNVSINESGSIVAIGASSNDAGGTNSGQVRIYEWNGTSWIQKGSDIDSDTTNANFGYTISLNASGTTFIAGGFSFVNGALGFIKVYSWNGTDWIQKGETILGITGSDFFGTAVDINNDGSIIAASSLTLENGNVRIFKFEDSAWLQQGDLIVGETENDQFGRSLSLNADGSILAAGTQFNDGNGQSAGHVRVFENTVLSLDYFNQNQVSIYPNPVQDFLQIKSNVEIIEIAIFNELGQIIKVLNPQNSFINLDFSTQTQGVYLFKIQTFDSVKTFKVVKK
uniref:T9SS type A sorting domain-containing protein n=1 Tax=Flavobacterium sp. TaxID=239 RepID=UPI004049A60C